MYLFCYAWLLLLRCVYIILSWFIILVLLNFTWWWSRSNVPSVPRFRESCAKKQTQTPDWPLTKGILTVLKNNIKVTINFISYPTTKKKQLKIASIQNWFCIQKADQRLIFSFKTFSHKMENYHCFKLISGI